MNTDPNKIILIDQELYDTCVTFNSKDFFILLNISLIVE
jgi:hypothetical protein